MNEVDPAFVLASDLGPASAPAAREDLLEWMDIRAGDAALELGPEADPPTASSLQLLVAAVASKRFGSHPLGPRAAAALAELCDIPNAQRSS